MMCCSNNSMQSNSGDRVLVLELDLAEGGGVGDALLKGMVLILVFAFHELVFFFVHPVGLGVLVDDRKPALHGLLLALVDLGSSDILDLVDGTPAFHQPGKSADTLLRTADGLEAKTRRLHQVDVAEVRNEPQVLLGLLAGESLSRVLLKQPQDEVLGEGGELGEVLALEGHLLANDVVDSVTVVLILEGRVPRDQLEQRDPHCPAVDLLRVASPQEHFGGLVGTGTRVGQHLLIPTSQLHVLADPEVDKLEGVLVDVAEDVGRLDVAVADTLLVEVGKGVEQFVEGETKGRFVHAEAERGEGRVFHKEVAETKLGVEVERLVLDDVGVLELADVDEVGLDGAVVFVFHLQDLHCRHLPVLPMHASLHHPVGPLAQLLPHLVALLKRVLSKVVLHPLRPRRRQALRVHRFGDGGHLVQLTVVEGGFGVGGEVLTGLALADSLQRLPFLMAQLCFFENGDAGDGGLEVQVLLVATLQKRTHHCQMFKIIIQIACFIPLSHQPPSPQIQNYSFHTVHPALQELLYLQTATQRLDNRRLQNTISI